MAISDFIKRKPIHKPTKKKPSTKAKKGETALTMSDPFLWCDADKNMVDDPVIYIDFDSDTDTIMHIIVEGEEVS